MKKGIGITLLLLSFQANAVIIDNGDYTTDTNLGLDYLDVGLVGGSYSSFLAGVTYNGRNWVLATPDNIASTWSQIFGSQVSVANITSNDFDFSGAQYDALAGLFDGVSGDLGLTGEAVIGDYTSHGYFNAIFGGGFAVHYVFHDSHYGAIPTGTTGAWLVSNSAVVPVPSTLALMGLVLAGLGIRARRKAV